MRRNWQSGAVGRAMTVVGLVVALCLAAALPAAAEGAVQGLPVPGEIVNPSFETGDLTGWQVEDLADPYLPIQVAAAGLTCEDPELVPLVGAPTDGTYALYTGWDGCGPGVIRLMQDLALPEGRPVLLFDYRAGWDITFVEPAGAQSANGPMRAQDRHFYVVVEEVGGGAELARYLILTAPGGMPQVTTGGAGIQSYTPTTPDTGNLLGTVDLSPFAGQSVRLVFEWTVPECFTGPALFQLDNLRLVQRRAAQTRTDVSVIVYGGWNGMVARCWVGGTAQPELITAVNSFGDAQAMWTFYPDSTWPVTVDADLPAGLDPDQWELKLVRISSPTLGWSNDEPGAAATSIVAGQQYQFVYQLVSK